MQVEPYGPLLSMPAYTMPPIAVGDPVVWRYSPNDDVAAAIVTAVGKGAISVLIFPPESRVGIPKEGVRHLSDPGLPKLLNHDGGCWDLLPLYKLVVALGEAGTVHYGG